MNLPPAPREYDQQDQANVRLLVQLDARRNLKVGEDIDTSATRVVLVAPNGNRYSLGVDNTGALTATAL